MTRAYLNNIVFCLALIVSLYFGECSWAGDALDRPPRQSRILAEMIPLDVSKVPPRPKPILELGDPFLETGPISRGVELPTGYILQPSLIVYGTYRTALQGIYDGDDYTTEWANRFDLFANLYLTQTERILAGVRFLDQNGRFTGYTFRAPAQVRPEGRSGFEDELNFDITTLFFEGDFGEIFPFLDPLDKHSLDIYFSIGRQPVNFQNGMLIADSIDAVGVSKINLKPPLAVNMRSAFIWGVDQINRTNLPSDDESSRLYGWFNEMDFRSSTVEFDVIYADGNDFVGQGIFAGLALTQRLGEFNTTFRILGSGALTDETPHVNDGVLFYNEISFTPHATDNLAYFNWFYAIDHFLSASRDPLDAGLLSPTGILFEAAGIGRYASPLSNIADDAFGGAIGYQIFSADKRRHIVLEIAGRYANDNGQRAIGPGARYQMAVGQRSYLRFDGYALYDHPRSSAVTSEPDDDFKFGLRAELNVNF